MPTPPARGQENSFAPQMIFLGLRPGGWAKYFIVLYQISLNPPQISSSASHLCRFQNSSNHCFLSPFLEINTFHCECCSCKNSRWQWTQLLWRRRWWWCGRPPRSSLAESVLARFSGLVTINSSRKPWCWRRKEQWWQNILFGYIKTDQTRSSCLFFLLCYVSKNFQTDCLWTSVDSFPLFNKVNVDPTVESCWAKTQLSSR